MTAATKTGARAKPTKAKARPKAADKTGKLTGRQAAFVAEYLKDKNATQAAIRAGYSPATARQTASENLTKPVIAAAIKAANDEMLAKVQEETGITLSRTLREIARIGYFDPRKLFQPDGTPKRIDELDDDTAAALAGVDVLEEFEGSGKDRVFVGYTKKYKVADKKGALDMLMKHLDGYNAENKGKAESFGEALAGFVGQIHQAGAGRLKFADRSKS